MSLPRQVVRGRTLLLGRRTSERRCFLRPGRIVNQICKFCLAIAAERTGMEIHCFDFLSNHFHVVATDVEGRLPEFMHWLDMFIAKCVNAKLGRWENFWAPGSYSVVVLEDRAALVGEMEYSFNNAISSGLVARMKDWPGAFSTPAQMERAPEVVHRPAGFFSECGSVPETAELRLTVPGNLGMTVAEMEDVVERGAQKLRQEARAAGRGFLGRRRVLKQSPLGRPRTSEVRRGLNPRVAAKNKRVRIAALKRLQEFVASYRDALESYLAGDRSVVFPHGTYWMRVWFGVTCSGP